MENLLEKVAGMLGGLWDWTVHLNGGLQIVLVLLAVVMSGVCAIVAKRMQSLNIMQRLIISILSALLLKI